MIVGNFMLLCEFDPDEVYRWFMEVSIDSFDWVMVPNVYGCLLYTSDAADDLLCVDLGGRRIIKKNFNCHMYFYL